MDTDFPAAHSMDTAWYAVDRDGHVGIFVTGSEGALPEAAAAADDESLPRLPSEFQGALFVYSYETEDTFFVYPYERRGVPPEPVHIDQLPPQLREAYGRLRLDSVSFAEAEHVQPWEFGPCVAGVEVGAYLTADLTAVRPIPGHEEDFHDLCLEAKKYLPPGLKNVRFEEPPGRERPKKKGKPRGKKKEGDDV